MLKLTTNFQQTIPQFSSQDLKTGELMSIQDSTRPDLTNHILLKTFDGLVDLNNPNKTWSLNAKLKGTKLLKGYAVTLTQQ